MIDIFDEEEGVFEKIDACEVVGFQPSGFFKNAKLDVVMNDGSLRCIDLGLDMDLKVVNSSNVKPDLPCT